ncbi:hypothetical protein Bca4012_068292 [Brassica carinata]
MPPLKGTDTSTLASDTRSEIQPDSDKASQSLVLGSCLEAAQRGTTKIIL